jgi:hypothetical protein
MNICFYKDIGKGNYVKAMKRLLHNQSISMVISVADYLDKPKYNNMRVLYNLNGENTKESPFTNV